MLKTEYRGLFSGVCVSLRPRQTEAPAAAESSLQALISHTSLIMQRERERWTTGKCVYAETNAWLLQIWGDDFSSKQMNAGHVIIYWTDTLKCSVALGGLWFLNRRDVPGLCTSPRGVKSSRVETWLRDARVRCRAAAPSPGHKDWGLSEIYCVYLFKTAVKL